MCDWGNKQHTINHWKFKYNSRLSKLYVSIDRVTLYHTDSGYVANSHHIRITVMPCQTRCVPYETYGCAMSDTVVPCETWLCRVQPVCPVHISNLFQQFIGLLWCKVDVCEVLYSDAVFTRVIVTKQRLDGVWSQQGMSHEWTWQSTHTYHAIMCPYHITGMSNYQTDWSCVSPRTWGKNTVSFHS